MLEVCEPLTSSCAVGERVIRMEIMALQTMVQHLDPREFDRACQLLLSCSGRIIVTGIGKSGHVARKVASTLASTGTPAFYLHPAEATHGDLGMITPQDVVIAISHSGETQELIQWLPTLKLLSVPLIALSGTAGSTLASLADAALLTHVEQEACPNNLAPTCSTTCALAMGDALAVAVLSARGFSSQDFARNHPGGALGRRLLTSVSHVMAQGNALPLVTLDWPMERVLQEMSEKRLGCVVVVDEQQRLLGILTDGDLRRFLMRHLSLPNTPIMDLITQEPKTIRSDILTQEAIAMMERWNITQLVVLNPTQQVIGLVHLHQLIKSALS